MPQYVFNHNGATTGKSGKAYRYKARIPVAAPAGEFDHLEAGSFEVTKDAEAPVPEGVVVTEAADGTQLVSATPGTPPDPAASQAGFPAEQGGGQKAADDSPLPSGSGEPNVKRVTKSGTTTTKGRGKK